MGGEVFENQRFSLLTLTSPPIVGHPRTSGEGKKRRPEKTRKGRGVSEPHKVITAYRCYGKTGLFYG